MICAAGSADPRIEQTRLPFPQVLGSPHNRPISAHSQGSVEFARFGDDLGEARLESRSRQSAWKRRSATPATEHFYDKLSREQGIDHAGEAGSGAEATRRLGWGARWRGLERAKSNSRRISDRATVSRITHGHLGRSVAEIISSRQGKAHTGTEHLGGVGVSKLICGTMRVEREEADRVTDLGANSRGVDERALLW